MLDLICLQKISKTKQNDWLLHFESKVRWMTPLRPSRWNALFWRKVKTRMCLNFNHTWCIWESTQDYPQEWKMQASCHDQAQACCSKLWPRTIVKEVKLPILAASYSGSVMTIQILYQNWKGIFLKKVILAWVASEKWRINWKKQSDGPMSVPKHTQNKSALIMYFNSAGQLNQKVIVQNKWHPPSLT